LDTCIYLGQHHLAKLVARRQKYGIDAGLTLQEGLHAV
jgi:hypothetical protein